MTIRRVIQDDRAAGSGSATKCDGPRNVYSTSRQPYIVTAPGSSGGPVGGPCWIVTTPGSSGGPVGGPCWIVTAPGSSGGPVGGPCWIVTAQGSQGGGGVGPCITYSTDPVAAIDCGPRSTAAPCAEFDVSTKVNR